MNPLFSGMKAQLSGYIPTMFGQFGQEAGLSKPYPISQYHHLTPLEHTQCIFWVSALIIPNQLLLQGNEIPPPKNANKKK
jgi:hypothetical protein